jgi:hypothetical protein
MPIFSWSNGMSQKTVSHEAIRLAGPDAISAHHHLNKVIAVMIDRVPDFVDSQECAHLKQAAHFLNTLDKSKRTSVEVLPE